MRWHALLGATVASLTLGVATGADCYRASAPGNESIARTISKKVIELESKRPDPKLRPTIVLQIADKLDDADVGGADQKLAAALIKSACLNKDRVLRDVRVKAGETNLPLAFASVVTDKFAQEALDRVSKIGYNSMDSETANVIRARDINYVVVLGGTLRSKAHLCTFDFEWHVSIDIHSVATREVATVAMQLGRLDPRSGTTYLKLIAQTSSPKRLRLLSTGAATACLGTVEIEAASSNHRQTATWTQEVGCIDPGQEKFIRPPIKADGNGWATSGEVTITPKDTCDKFSIDDFPIADVFSLNNAVPPSDNQGYATGYSTVCGCYGPAAFNQPYPSQSCASGRAVNLGCNAPCSAGGWQYRSVCIN